MEAVIQYIKDGGIFIYPIILGTLWALTMVIERTLFFLMTATRLTKQQTLFFSKLESEGVAKAFDSIAESQTILARVLRVGLDNHRKPISRIEEKLEVLLLSELPIYNKFLPQISTLAGMMPMLGLLGTVTGMISTFEKINLHGTGDAQAMAGGISEALITTQAGMVAAIPIILGHLFISNRVKKITATLHYATSRLIDYLKDHDA